MCVSLNQGKKKRNGTLRDKEVKKVITVMPKKRLELGQDSKGLDLGKRPMRGIG